MGDLLNLIVPWAITAFSTERHQSQRVVHEDAKIHSSPIRAQCIAWYAEVAGWDPTRELGWSRAFAMWRDSIISQSIASRYAVTQASSDDAKQFGEDMGRAVEISSELIQRVSNDKTARPYL
jgi:aminoglycoside phosphotransferase (APT) family kinase protein